MSLQEQIRNIIFYYIKTNYKNYLKDHNLKYIEDDKIKGIITKMYVDKKKDLQLFIKTCLKEMMNDNMLHARCNGFQTTGTFQTFKIDQLP